jgi:hypothetical protein
VARRPQQPPARPPPGTAWPLPLIEVDAGTVLYRLTRLHFPVPAYFGRAALFRFDAPDRSFGVCYLGTSLDCCLLEPLIPTPKPGGRPCVHSRRTICNAIFYRVRSGCAWRMLASGQPP